MALLEYALDAGLAAHNWVEDQRWTLARVTALIEQLLAVSYTLRGTSYLLHRVGWSPQAPQRRAAERDEEAVATWIKETWPRVERLPRGQDAWICFEDEAGQSLRPPRTVPGPAGAAPWSIPAKHEER